MVIAAEALVGHHV